MSSLQLAGRLHFRKIFSGHFSETRSQSIGEKLHKLNLVKKPTVTFLLFCLGWLVLNSFQSYFTPIANDEAYYWLYAQHLAWGYFDHPPMIALFIKWGHYFFDGEIGTRLLTILTQILCMALIWKIIGEKNISTKKFLLFFGLAAVIPVFTIYGFIATPDSPLLLWTAVFLFSYKMFLDKPGGPYWLWMSIAMAGLMYSKYHGALIIILVMLSNISLLTDRRFWLAAIVAMCLFIPHIVWQIQHGFPTFHFQMMDRMESIHVQHFFEFWLNQMIAFNPIVLIIVCMIFIKTRPSSVFERALYFIPIGFFGFFWISSLWTRAEPHWTAAASIPVLILLYRYITQLPIRSATAIKWILPSLALIIMARLTIIFDFLPFPHEFRQQENWVHDVSLTAGPLPAVFINTYQKPSVYTYYTGKPAMSLNNVHYRQNQFDIWDFEEEWQGKEVAFFIKPSDSLDISVAQTVPVNGFLHFTEILFSVQNINIQCSLPEERLFPHDTLTFEAIITNHASQPLVMNHPDQPIMLSALFFKNKKLTSVPVAIKENVRGLDPGDSFTLRASCLIPELREGKYGFVLGYRTGLIPEAFHGRPQKIEISTDR